MNWPTSQDYNEAIQNAASSFSDPALKSGEVVVNAIGLPVPRSGNFADVYRFKGGDGKTWALKCFTRKVAGLQERYAKIDEHIGKANFPFTVGFNYLADGIRIRGQWFPLLKMEWVEGFTLNEFVRDNAGKPQYLHALTQMWAKLCARLRDGNFAHADLQHGNVLLVPGDAQNKLGLKLIDYDGMWVPSLAEIHSGEIGHPNFQHPLRLKDRLYNGDVDRFPHLVIACALRATLLGGRALWDKFDNGDNLLFKEACLRDPGKAAVFKTLWNLHDDVLCVLVGKIALGAREPLRKTPWLDDLLLSEEGKRLRDDEEAKVVEILGVGPHFTAPKALAAPAAVQNEFNEFAFEEDEAAPAPAKTASRKASPARDAQKPKKKAVAAKANSKLPLYIGGGVAAALLIVGIIAMTSGGKKQTPNQQEVAKVEDNNKNTAPKVIVPSPKKDKTGEVKADNPTPKQKEEPAKQKEDLPKKVPDDVAKKSPSPSISNAEWDQFVLARSDSSTIKDGYVRLSPEKGTVFTKKTYSGDVDIVVVARTDGKNIRLDAFSSAILVFNTQPNPAQVIYCHPEGIDRKTYSAKITPLEPNTWYTLRWTITAKGMTVSVNGAIVFEEKRDNDLSFARPVWVSSGAGSTVDVKSFAVRPIAATQNEAVAIGAPALLKAPFTKEQADAARAEWAKFLNIPERKQLDLGKGVKLELVLIPPGQFRMGKEGNTGNQVAHDVTISKPFYMAATETTQEQYQAVIGKNPAEFALTGGWRSRLGQITDTSKFPIENVNWHEADAFCQAAKVQLPTEAEWEYACRAGTATKFHFGDSLNGTQANCNGTKPLGTDEPGPFLQRPTYVGSYKPNAFGLFDMHGNVTEWCRDWYAEKTDDLPARDPERTVQSPGGRVLRGGQFNDAALRCPSGHRHHFTPETRNSGWGFRVTLPVPPPEAMVKKDEPKGVEAPIVGAPAPLKAPFSKEQAEQVRATWAKHLSIPERKQLVLGKGVKLELVLIPPGEFMMGTNPRARRVVITKPFYMAATETTQEQYEAVVRKNPSGFSANGIEKRKLDPGMDTTKFPVEQVSWLEAESFGKVFGARLPTEAQWEYACRAGTMTDFHFGNSLHGVAANCDGTKPYGTNEIGPNLGRSTKVASYPANAFGLYDMHGNINEWCRDFFAMKMDDLGDKDPERTSKESRDSHVLRSGSWKFSAGECRATSRRSADADYRISGLGFRVIVPVPDQVIPPKMKDRVEGKARKPGEEVEVEIAKGVKMKFCWIPAGTAMLGSPEDEKGRVRVGNETHGADNKVHEYTTKGFWLGKYEVTQQEWLAVMGGANPSRFGPNAGVIKAAGIQDTSRFPVEKISWDLCQTFIQKLNDTARIPAALGKSRFALPHEDEWEYACRGGQGNKQPFYFGAAMNGTQANCSGEDPYGGLPKGPYLKRTTEVGSYAKAAPHPWGLCDMHGNVWEWCSNWSDDSQTIRALRGGAWWQGARFSRSASRRGRPPDTLGIYEGYASDADGFRVAILSAERVEAPPPAKASSPIEKVLLTKKLAEVKIEDARFLPVAEGTSDKKLIFGDVPAWLQKRTFHFKDKQAGFTQFTVESAGIVLMAVSPRYKGGGNASGNWKPDCISREEFLRDGWHEAGTLPIHDMIWPFYWRECKKGENFKVRTEKYLAPIIIK